ncbi:MAG: hypothetical protein GEV11_29215 [Streptosporangiales bacterium]|nr:hypothetical protein [Streptosporangiales bacterium]
MRAMTRYLAEGHDTTWSLPPETTSAAAARELVHRTLAASDVPEPMDTALVVSELVTNAVVHGGPPIRLTLRVERNGAGPVLVCEVSDTNPARPRLRDGGLDAAGGRGLLLVHRLSESWGARPAGAGKTVWARLPLPRSHRTRRRRRSRTRPGHDHD